MAWGDEFGLLWEEAPRERKASSRGPAFNEFATEREGYTPPGDYVSILGRDQIGLDIETFDPLLKTKGSGSRRKDGFITGVALAYDEHNCTYYPTNHVNKSRCIDETSFYDQLRADAAAYTGEIVGANLQYDLDWLASAHGVRFERATIRDVQVAEPLLDENKYTYSLESLATQYLGEGKESDFLADHYGADYIQNMHKVDPGHAASYAEKDAMLPLRILAKQRPLLEADQLTNIFDIESRLTNVLLRMRESGVRINASAAESAYERTQAEASTYANEITRLSGINVNIWAADSVARAYDGAGIGYPRTRTGKPSFTKNWLAAQRDPLSRALVAQREYDKIGNTFIKSYILDGHVNGRIYTTFNQLRSDAAGTVSGRLSSANPNLQNIPSRHEVLGPLLRSMFIPEDGMLWGCADWSQIEYRLLIHFASLLNGIDVSLPLSMYRNDAKADFHAIAAELTGVPRKRAKSINFGVVYGMGVSTMADNLGLSMDDAAVVLGSFHAKFPFLKKMAKTATGLAEARGYIRTILGRRRRFNMWEAGNSLFHTREAALLSGYGGVRRAKTHSALNALLQGSNADLMKKAMCDMLDAGLFEVLVPHITVHDEFNVSLPDSKIGREAFGEMVRLMEKAVELAVPVYVSSDTGINWDDAK